jgi:hypothetical protein
MAVGIRKLMGAAAARNPLDRLFTFQYIGLEMP